MVESQEIQNNYGGLKGVLLGHGGVKGCAVRIQPPLVITEEQLDTTVEVIDECLKELR